VHKKAGRAYIPADYEIFYEKSMLILNGFASASIIL